MDPHDEQVLAELRALVQVPGALRVITSEHQCCGGVDGYVGGAPPAETCAAFAVPLTDPGHFVVQPVVRLEGPDERGRMTAYTANGDYCTGRPAAVLSRLRQWRGG